jgi:hypothetical protein
MDKNIIIKVKHSGVISTQVVMDEDDGVLSIVSRGKQLPFLARRIYWINEFDRFKSIRGKHAHKKCKQVIFCLHGSFQLKLDDGRRVQTIKMNDPHVGIILGSMLWHEMTRFSKDCVIMVLASQEFNEVDYIRDYKEFIKYINR